MKINEIITEARDRAPPATDLRVGDHVTADTSRESYPGGHKTRTGRVSRVGQTGVHIAPDDGGPVEYHPYKIVKRTQTEGWGSEPARDQHHKNMVAVARVLDKYQDDPELSAIASYLFQNNWSAESIEATLQGRGKYDLDWWKANMAKKPRFQNHTQMMIDKYLTPKEAIVDEEPASRALCTSGKPDSALGASNLASCKSQGYRARDGGKSHKVGSDRIKVRGKKIKGKKYGGPIPDWS
jgi:hypothetical protein